MRREGMKKPKFQRRAGGPRRVVESVKEFLEKLKGNEKMFFAGSKFFVTNVTRVVSTPR